VSLTYHELAHYSCSVSRSDVFQNIIITLGRNDITDVDKLEIEFSLPPYGESENTDQRDTAVKSFEKLFALFISADPINEIIPDEQKVEYIEAFVSSEGKKTPFTKLVSLFLGTNVFLFKKAFAKYSLKKGFAVVYTHDLSTIIGWAFSLIYRKVYILGAAFILLDLLVLYLAGDILGEFFRLFVWPFNP
jgi:hypothetical protein